MCVYVCMCVCVCVCVCVCMCVCVCVRYFEFKASSNLRCIPLLKRHYKKKSLLIYFIVLKITTLLARPLVCRGKLCFRGFRRVKSFAWNLRRILIFRSEKCEKRVRRKFEVIRYLLKGAVYQIRNGVLSARIARYRK